MTVGVLRDLVTQVMDCSWTKKSINPPLDLLSGYRLKDCFFYYLFLADTEITASSICMSTFESDETDL